MADRMGKKAEETDLMREQKVNVSLSGGNIHE